LTFTGPGRDRDHDQAGRGLRGAWFRGGFGEKSLARRLLGGGSRGRPLLLELSDLQPVGLEVDLRCLVEAPVGQARFDHF
jgi:hypothetical protein